METQAHMETRTGMFMVVWSTTVRHRNTHNVHEAVMESKKRGMLPGKAVQQ